MAARKKVEPPRALSKMELESLLCEQLRTASSLKSSEIKKGLPKAHQWQLAEALDVARELAARGDIYRWAKGTAEWFFASEPNAALEKLVRAALAEGPLPADALQQRITLETRIPKPRFDEWKKGALARGDLFELAAGIDRASTSKAKRLALEPDVGVVLKKAIAELKKGVSGLEAKGIARERIAQVVWQELGFPGAPPVSGTLDRDVFWKALHDFARESPPGTLLSLRELRSRSTLEKDRFDRAALSLSRDGAITLHHHDHPAGLDDLARSQLVEDARGTYYVGVGLKSASGES